MLTLQNNEYMCISDSDMFICVHRKKVCGDMRKTAPAASYANDKKHFRQRLIGKTEGKGDKSHVC